MTEAETLLSFNLGQPVDTISSVQLQNRSDTVFSIGCYELLESETRRTGSIHVGVVKRGHNQEDNEKVKPHIQLYQGHCLNWGLLDVYLRHSDEDDDTLFAFGIGSDAAFHVLRIQLPNDDDNKLLMVDDVIHLSHLKIEETTNASQDIIGIALDIWNPSVNPSTIDQSTIVAAWSCSDGTLCYSQFQYQRLYSVENDSSFLVTSWHGHDAEIWSVGLDSHSQGVILASGSDDCTIKIWDTRNALDNPIALNSKSHSMGVTVVSFDPRRENRLFTGSYDEYLRIWDQRMLDKPIQELRMPGGIWRLKFEEWETMNDRLLVAATHGGCQVYSVDFNNSNDYQFSLLKSHTSHKSMAYGIAPLGHYNTNTRLYISGSFYDKYVSFWEV